MKVVLTGWYQFWVGVLLYSVRCWSISSIPFFIPQFNFTCPSVSCDSTPQIIQDGFHHMVVGADHPMAFSLLMFRICEAFQWCMKPQNFKFVVQRKQSTDKDNSFANISFVLRSLSLPFEEWQGTFSADLKMTQSYATIKSFNDPNRIMYQTDIDEIPDSEQFKAALREFESGSCDSIWGFWRDRIALGGALSPVSLSQGGLLGEQYPLRCEISHNVVRGGMTRKTVAYRSNYRIDGGQHQLWCDGGDRQHWNKTEACAAHIRARGKSRYIPLIMPYLTGVTRRPRPCKNTVTIDHYKFIFGIEDYLKKRIFTYRQLRLHWWRDSKKFIDHITKYEGKVCVDCAGSNCFNTITNTSVPITVGKEF